MFVALVGIVCVLDIVGGRSEHLETEETAGEAGAGLRLCQSQVCLSVAPLLAAKAANAFLTTWTCILTFILNHRLSVSTQMVAGNQVNNLRNKHSSTDGQGWPTQGRDGRGHE